MILTAMLLLVTLSFGVFTFLLLHKRMRQPLRPVFVHALDILLYPLMIAKVGPFKRPSTVEGAFKAALKKKRATLDEFQDLDFLQPYAAIFEGPEVKAQSITPMGFIISKDEMLSIMCRRIDFTRFIKKVDVSSVPLQTPVFVMGLPRTGTTFLHRLLSLDPTVRAPLTWELVSPVPRTADSDLRRQADDRIERRKLVDQRIQKMLMVGGSTLKHIHEIGTDLPEECMLFLNNDIPLTMQALWACFMNPNLFVSLDATAAFRNYRRCLQILSWQLGERDEGRVRRWVLKCPGHLLWVKAIASAFPDAKIVWTHRHPVNAVPSLASLCAALHSVYYDSAGLNKNHLGKTVKVDAQIMLQKAQEDLDATKLCHAHVVYNDLVTDPVAIVKQVYTSLGLKYTPEYEAKLTEYLEQNMRDRKAKMPDGHTYLPQTYGLTSEELTSEFKSYLRMYNISH